MTLSPASDGLLVLWSSPLPRVTGGGSSGGGGVTWSPTNVGMMQSRPWRLTVNKRRVIGSLIVLFVLIASWISFSSQYRSRCTHLNDDDLRIMMRSTAFYIDWFGILLIVLDGKLKLKKMLWGNETIHLRCCRRIRDSNHFRFHLLTALPPLPFCQRLYTNAKRNSWARLKQSHIGLTFATDRPDIN